MIGRLTYLYSRFFKKYLRGKSVHNSRIDKTAYICSGSQIVNSSLGRYSNCGYDCQIIDTVIGNFCCLAENVTVGSAEHPMNWVSMSPVFENIGNSGSSVRFAKCELPLHKKTIIDNDVWIGHSAIIKAGVHIATGAVIGAGAVVTKDVEPYSVVGGCPARHIKYRFDNDMIDRLLKSKWWNLSDKELYEIGSLIPYPQKFLDALNMRNNNQYTDIQRFTPPIHPRNSKR